MTTPPNPAWRRAMDQALRRSVDLTRSRHQDTAAGTAVVTLTNPATRRVHLRAVDAHHTVCGATVPPGWHGRRHGWTQDGPWSTQDVWGPGHTRCAGCQRHAPPDALQAVLDTVQQEADRDRG